MMTSRLLPPSSSTDMMTSRLLPPSSSTDMMTSRLLNLDFFQSAMLTSSLLLAASSCWYLATAGYQRKELLNLIANAKRCRINLFKRHRFAIANSKYHLLNLFHCSHLLVNNSFLLIVMSLLMTSSMLSAPAVFFIC
ncbi:hypothetical protein F511_03770 [Dorcoceras hygrometricum]|uniref:Uncharacterized protein n=1 Tax=Dorcoceras hygrometricum TaxID=472368 RepID=A0A2Z7B6S5_9LAMI|nr:hypothetical protein F511_03770 [Dorcoceras hygrometricum]